MFYEKKGGRRASPDDHPRTCFPLNMSKREIFSDDDSHWHRRLKT